MQKKKSGRVNYYGSLSEYKESMTTPDSNESKADAGGGESDAVRNQLSMGIDGYTIANALMSGAGVYSYYKAYKAGAIKLPKSSLPRPSASTNPKQFSPDHPVFGRMPSTEAGMEYDAAKAAESIIKKYKVGDYVEEIGGKLTAKGKLNLQNTMMNYINKKK